MTESKNIYPKKIYIKKILTTFLPPWIYKLSWKRYADREYWKKQNAGANHSYENYNIPDERVWAVLRSELESKVKKDDKILDLGCNCGLYLSLLKKEGYQNLTGVDVCATAIEYGKKTYDLSAVELIPLSYEDALPKLFKEGRSFDLIYSCGASITLVHPSFDIIKSICQLSPKYIVLVFNIWAHAYPRFLEYEFAKHGYTLDKYLRLPDEVDGAVPTMATGNAISVYRRV